MSRQPPDLSVIAVVASVRERAELLSRALGLQTLAPRMEVVFADIAPEGATALAPIPGVDTTIVRLPGSLDMGHARAESLRRARAPVVAYLEDHTVPDPGWAAAVLRALADTPAVAAVYAFTNGSPDTWWYRSVFMAEYGSLAYPLPARPIDVVAANNIAYRRQPLLALGARLDGLMEQDFFLQREMGAAFSAVLAGEARVAHQTNSRWRELLRGHFEYGRSFAAQRIKQERWGNGKRIVAAAAVPAIVPALRLLRVARTLPGRSLWRAFLAALPVYALLYAWDALGEAYGYLGWGEPSPRSLIWLELETERARRP